MSTYGLGLNTGSYFGSGYSASGTSSISSNKRAASNSNIKRMTTNITSGYEADLEIIQKYFKNGQTDKAIEKYEALLEDCKSSLGGYNYALSDAEAESILAKAYENTTGSSLINTIEKETCGSFMTGLKQSIPIFGLFCNDTSEAEALAKLTGDEVPLKDKVLEFAGMAVGTVAFWALGGPVFGLLGKGLSALGTTVKGISWATKAAKGIDAAAKATKAVGIATKVAGVGTTALNALEEGAEMM